MSQKKEKLNKNSMRSFILRHKKKRVSSIESRKENQSTRMVSEKRTQLIKTKNLEFNFRFRKSMTKL